LGYNSGKILLDGEILFSGSQSVDMNKELRNLACWHYLHFDIEWS